MVRHRSLFVLEQTLGHVTHGQNLRSLVPLDGRVELEVIDVEFDTRFPRIPIWSNWTVRAGVRARRGVRRAGRTGSAPASMFVHTQVPAVLLGGRSAAIPTIVSVDATPAQYDSLGDFYGHDRGPAWLERVKLWLNRRCFGRAAHIVAWSAWAKEGLVAEYGVESDRITVIAPGVDVERWRPGSERPAGPVRVLFVGGDLARKGGDLLLSAFGRLADDDDLPDVELHLVTGAPVAARPGVHVHAGLGPNTPELMQLYRDADIFCLPTLGDCLPMVLAEAAASGLPLISTDVGAIGEIVRDGETGLLVEPGDGAAVEEALRRLLVDAELRRRCGAGARELAVAEHDARSNASRIVDLLLAAGS